METTVNYRMEVLECVKYAMREEIAYNEDCKEWDIDKWHDFLWTHDGVTGNGSGSYTFNTYKAKDYVLNSDDGLAIIDEMVNNGFMDKERASLYEIEWESIDVTIRCYLLEELISEAVEELQELGELVDVDDIDQLTQGEAMAEYNDHDHKL